jgi:hypothetical protein
MIAEGLARKWQASVSSGANDLRRRLRRQVRRRVLHTALGGAVLVEMLEPYKWMFIRGSGSGLVGLATPTSQPRPG